MKATLEFTLPEENTEYETVMQANRMVIAIDEFSNFLRNKLKYGDLSEAEAAIYEQLREEWFSLIKDINII